VIEIMLSKFTPQQNETEIVPEMMSLLQKSVSGHSRDEINFVCSKYLGKILSNIPSDN